MKPEDQEETSFWWNGSLWQYTRNLYGLRNATACFQRVMDHHLRLAGLENCCVVFVDDLLCYSHTAEQHLLDLTRVIAMLRSINIKLHPDKSVLIAHKVEFLGHLAALDTLKREFSREGLCLRRLDPTKPVYLHTDFSAVGISGVLGQQDEAGNEYM
ncbi:Retrovirus-related Pol polyprotein from transposon [Tetrabaena socialis]|uniref:Retrovirus-related Pol polyprotein from transposon n=1 Tax=Tetrabaena socialis TaxID=47790 RepID=A0A2J7ZLV6_9CHLO|nr:Retrovirus-related Pol polyprotein from transposon [Tetrabaena socialis]|eukprot:PNH01246.1 Retrovirus-related Pol polyprotein from transposon [Tetrabaena socialis]